MSDRPIAAADPDSRRLRLDTLVRLRWLAVAGQAATVLGVAYGLHFPLPVGPCFALIALSAWVNIFLRVRYRASRRLEDRLTALLLGYDLIQLGALLFLTGGLQNPFAILVMAPVMVSAMTLTRGQTLALGALAMAVVSALAFFHHPLPWTQPDGLELPAYYVAGVWLALACAILFMGFYAFRVANEARQLAEALTATELVLAREMHLSALDGLAAAAAHELGTPLATIALVAKELEREIPAGTPHAEDVALLRSQSQRCRDILAKLTSLSGHADWPNARQPFSHLLAEVVEPHREFGIAIRIAPPRGTGPEPIGRRNPAILYGLGNLVENAVDFARSGVDLAAAWTADTVTLTITDDGPGFAADIIARIGDPYVTSRARSAAGDDTEAGGLGLGFFIAKTLLERSGAQLHFANREPPEAGAVVRIVWPRSALEAAPPAAPAAYAPASDEAGLHKAGSGA